MQRNNFIFLLGSYYPNASANGNCVGKLARELLSRRYNVTIIAQKENINSKEYEKTIYGDVVRISTKFNNIFNNVRGKKLSGNNKIIASFILFVLRLCKCLAIIFHKNTVFNSRVKLYYEALENLNIDDNNSVIIPCCFPIEAAIAAAQYKNSHREIMLMPWLIDLFADSGTLHRLKINKKIKYNNNLKIEKSIIAASDRILFFYSWGSHLQKLCKDFSSDKFIQVGLPLLSPAVSLKKNTQSNKTSSDTPISFVYAGSLLKDERSPQVALQVCSNLINDIEFKLHIYHVGNCSSIIHSYSKLCPDHIIDYGGVTNDIAQKAIMSADVLILIGNMHAVQIPSKVFEYILTSKPIIYFKKAEYDPVHEILKKYGNFFMIEENSWPSEQILRDLINFLRTPHKVNEDVECLFQYNSSEYIVDIILKSI